MPDALFFRPGPQQLAIAIGRLWVRCVRDPAAPTRIRSSGRCPPDDEGRAHAPDPSGPALLSATTVACEMPGRLHEELAQRCQSTRRRGGPRPAGARGQPPGSSDHRSLLLFAVILIAPTQRDRQVGQSEPGGTVAATQSGPAERDEWQAMRSCRLAGRSQQRSITDAVPSRLADRCRQHAPLYLLIK